jgi:trigger factor
VRQRYGKQVRQDIVAETMQQSLQQAIRDEDLHPASMPRIDSEPENLPDGNLEFSALIEVYPEVGPIEVGDIELERPETDVTEQDVDDMLQTLREQRKRWSDVERKPQAGDRVLIDYAADADGTRFPAEGEQRLAIVMGDTGFEALEQALAAIEPGQSNTIELEYPEKFREQALAGKKASTTLKVFKVSEAEMPEVDEEFIKSFGIEDGQLESLKHEIRGNLERELKQATNTLLKVRLVDALLQARPDLDVPSGMVREEARGMAQQLASRQGQEQPDSKLVDALMDQARERVRAGLLMGALAQQNGLRVDAGRVREAIESIAGTYEQPAEVMQLYYGNQQLMQQVESSVLEEQVVDWALENAKVTPKAMSFQEVIGSATQAARGA